MTVPELDTALRQALPGKIFELAAPAGVKEYAVWHLYGAQLLIGDDVVQDETPRIQIDVIWQKDKSLLPAVKAALSAAGQAYDLIEYGYDDEWASMRCILQLEVA